MDKRNKRRINVAHFIGSLHVGGAENQVVLLANALDPSKFRSHVIVMHDQVGGFRENLHSDIRFFSIDYRARYSLAALYRLYRYLVKNRIDILHCHMYHATVKGAVVGRAAGVPVILSSEHGKNTWKRWWHHAMEKYIVNRILAKRVAVSEDIRRIRICEDGVKPENIMVLPNFVNTDVPTKSVSATPRIIGALGRLVDAKDYPVLINAVGRLISEGRDVQLYIAGEGDERQELEKLVSDKKLDGAIKLLGMQNGGEFMSSIDIFAMSSKREGVPVSLLEAMARELPVAATAVGGIPEIVTDRVDGLLCEPGKSSDLADNIAALLDNEDMRRSMGKAAREKVIQCYGVTGVINIWATFYSEMFQEKLKI